jgi:hypothetical protein
MIKSPERSGLFFVRAGNWLQHVQASDALARWRDRNAVRASAAREACFADPLDRSKTVSADEVSAARKPIAETKAEISAGFRRRMHTEGKPACTAALHFYPCRAC